MAESSTPPTPDEPTPEDSTSSQTSAGGPASEESPRRRPDRSGLEDERAAGEIARGKLGAEPRRVRREEREAKRAPVKKGDLTRGPEDLTRDRHEEREEHQQREPEAEPVETATVAAHA